ncbi:unnamed protein product, partial [Soboliphyme baturini]|uniref:C2 domain-containing protein n=1 Tax=Soboliphyme baturini TaxID=241478 RepID=A0A183J205_9BILA
KTHKVSEPSSFVQFSVDGDVRSSSVKEKTSNPIYQQKFSFFLSDVKSQYLKVEAKEMKRERSCLGQVLIPIKTLLQEKDLELLRHPWQLALGSYVSTITLSLKLRVC